jgi:hypothetical protein
MAELGVLDRLMAPPGERAGDGLATAAALAEAAAAIARLDQALASHPLRQGPPQVWGCEGQRGIFASVV